MSLYGVSSEVREDYYIVYENCCVGPRLTYAGRNFPREALPPYRPINYHPSRHNYRKRRMPTSRHLRISGPLRGDIDRRIVVGSSTCTYALPISITSLSPHQVRGWGMAASRNSVFSGRWHWVCFRDLTPALGGTRESLRKLPTICRAHVRLFLVRRCAFRALESRRCACLQRAGLPREGISVARYRRYAGLPDTRHLPNHPRRVIRHLRKRCHLAQLAFDF